VKNPILPEFQDFLVSRSLVPEKNVSFYANWVSKFLAFCNRNEHLRPDLKVEKFKSGMIEPSSDCNMEKVRSILSISVVLLIFFLLTACGPKHRIVYERRVAPPKKEEVKKEMAKEEKPSIPKVEKRQTQEVQYGVASWYGDDFHGKPTSSGEIYDMYQLTCAHNTLPLGTTVMVTNLENGRSVEVKVNDRGPFVKERIIDLSYAAAHILGMWEKGTALVKLEAFGPFVEGVQRFTVQVGSFIDEANAQKLADQLRQAFDDVYVTTVETITQKYHRVRVGQFETQEPALSIAEKLSQMGFKVLVTSR